MMLNPCKVLLAMVFAMPFVCCLADGCTNQVAEIERVIAASEYDAALFSTLNEVKDSVANTAIAERAKLKGVRLLAASRLLADDSERIAEKELGAYAPIITDEKLTIGEFQLGMSIEDTYAVLLAKYPSVKPRLYLDDNVLCIADRNSQDLAWANVKSREVHWLTLTPTIVRRIVGFKTGSFADLKRSVETKLGISFTTDVISKGEVSQQIGTIDTVDGETLRYFTGAMAAGEEFTRTVRKTVNQHSINFELASESGIAALVANVFEDAMQKDENTRNARSPRFAPRGSLQLLWTKNAVQGDWNSSGGSRRNGLRTSTSDLQSLSSELEGALDQLNRLSL